MDLLPPGWMGLQFLEQHRAGRPAGKQLFQNRSVKMVNQAPKKCPLSKLSSLCVSCHTGSVTCPPGSRLGDGLTQEAAAALGLDPGTAVGASLIDAHAGGLGMLS